MEFWVNCAWRTSWAASRWLCSPTFDAGWKPLGFPHCASQSHEQLPSPPVYLPLGVYTSMKQMLPRGQIVMYDSLVWLGRKT